MAIWDRRAEPALERGGFAETTRFLVFLFLAALLLRSLVVAPFSIPSGSMLPAMRIGDHLFVAKWPYGITRHSLPFGLITFDGSYGGAEPERGDVVVFRARGPDGDERDVVKRLIGRPGDTIWVTGGQVHLNGEPLARVRIADWLMPLSPNSPCRHLSLPPEAAVCRFARYRETLPDGRSWAVLDQGSGPLDDFGPVTVPEGHYFVMGDNRDDSLDSRVDAQAGGLGMIPRDRLVGRALVIFFSTDGSAEWLKPWTWFSAARFDRFGETF